MDTCSIPIEWIKRYARENGYEIKDILDYMIKEYLKEAKKTS